MEMAKRSTKKGKPSKAPAATTASSSSSTSAAAKSGGGSNEFGASLPADMAAWASAQLQRIAGSGDLTLATFCMSLASTAEIKTYWREYLGDNAAVRAFADEFVSRKEAAAAASQAGNWNSSSRRKKRAGKK
jgi:hypothetical protein